MEKKIAEHREQIKRFESSAEELSQGLQIKIATVSGDTIVRKRVITTSTTRLRNITNLVDLRKELDFLGREQDRLFEQQAGSISWTSNSSGT